MNILPNKASDLINVALADLIKCERSPKYTINMGMWHWPRISGKCAVCLAGSVMAQSLSATPNKMRGPLLYPRDVRKKLLALNDLRVGEVNCALAKLGIRALDKVPGPRSKEPQFDRKITPYCGLPGLFKRQMRKLAKDLAKAGL